MRVQVNPRRNCYFVILPYLKLIICWFYFLQQLHFEPTGIHNEHIFIRIEIPKELEEFF